MPLDRRARRRLRVPDRDAVRGGPRAAAASARCRSSSSSAPEGYSKVSGHVLFESLLTPWRLILRGGRAEAIDGLSSRPCVTSSSWSRRRIRGFRATASAASWSRSPRAWPRADTRSTSSRRGIRRSRAARSKTASTSISFTTRPSPSLNVFGYAAGSARGHRAAERRLGRGAARARRRLVQGAGAWPRRSAPP